VADTYLYLFNASGEMIVSNDDYSGEGHCSNTKQAYLKQLLPAGTYYLVSEGKTGNGNITTNITVDIPMTNLGSKSAPFDYSNTQNTDNSANYYTGQPAKDVWYKFTLEKTLEVIISHCESGLSDTYLSLLDASRKLIVSNDDYDGDGHCFNIRQAYLKRLLAAGTYYVVSEGKTGNGNITTTISADIPITDLGSKNAPFDYSLAQNTINTANYYAGQPTNDAWYKFTLEIPMEIVISLCESRISDNYLSLLDASRNLITFNDDYDGDGRCFYTKQAYLKQLLSAGTYYVVLEGKTENGIIAPRITASVPIVDLGAKSRSFSETLTGNTDVLADYYSGQSTKDIWYRFELNMEMHITVSNCGSALPDTYLYLLDKSKNLIVSNDDYVGSGQCTNTKHAYLQRLLESGVYYIVSEGKGQNGGIVTIISGITASVGSTASQPSDGQNYIRTRTYLSENGNLFMDAVQYYDGLGRPSQQVHTGITPGRKDLIARREYDAFGRESKAWLPVPVAGNKGAYYTGTFSTDVYGNDTYSYSEPVYEPSPLNRIEKQYGPGQAWRDGNGHFVKTDYLTNNSSYPCAYYYVSGDNLVKNSNYTDNNLYVTEITDEDGNESYEFKDKLDRVVLQRQMEGTDRYDTYYVYDDFGNLRFVLPPLAADSATTNKSYSVSTSYIKNYAYIYKYDHRNRCTEKKLPGCEPVNYTYDNADRLIFYQDGELKDKSQWHFSIPDVFGRVVLEGICTGPSWNDAVKAEYSNNASGTFSAYGYTVSNINLTLVQLLRVNYYDNYKFKTKQAFANNTHYDYTSTLTGFENKRYGADGDEVKSKGLLTGSITVLLDNSGDRLYSVFYYDSRGRMIQSVASNHLNGYEKEYVNYSFTGQPTRKQTLHSAQGKSNITEIYSYYYDHADRPVITEYQIDNGETITLSELTYDDLDRVKTKGVHGSKEKITYNYNIRNWVKKIDSGRFKEILYYTEGNAPLFNGNISQVEWGFGLKDNVWIQDDYLFSYDGLNRLTKSTYGVSTSNPLNNYTEEAAYDKMGNITALKRSGHIELGTFDKLSLTYNGNRLSSVTEAGKPGEGFIKPPGNPAREYAYNKNGALTEDFNGGISQIQYNWLNLPERIQFAYGHSTQYKYDATGMKHRVTHTSVKSNLNVPAGKTTIPATQQISYVLTTDYVSNLVYENESLKYILNPEGYAVRTMNGGYAYNYYQKDHLGNNRVVLEINRVNSLVNQTTDYYPFGMPYLNNSFPERQPYKFGGKELDEMHGLNWYDFHARQLSTAIPRFTTVDPLAEKYYSVSPYVYCNNNPVRFMDSDGREFIDSNGKRVTIMYNRDGSLSFSKNATTDIVRAANALNLTDAGRSQLVKMDQSDIKVKLNISSDTKITQRADGKTSYVYGEAIQGNYNEKDNYGRKVNHDGTYGIKDASITIYEGTIKEGIRNGSGLKHEGLSLEQAIGAVVGHEGVHATDKVEINKDLKAEMQGKTHVDREVKPNQIEQIIINQYKK
jgi:RHS repeat-associated protein